MQKQNRGKQNHETNRVRTLKTEPVSNWRIPGQTVRIIEGKNHRIIGKEQAITEAKQAGLDLILLGKPPEGPAVCKIEDLGKALYLQRKANKNHRRPKTKEVEFHVTTAEHDKETKMRHIREFLVNGHRVSVRLTFRGREKAHPEIGYKLMDTIIAEIHQGGTGLCSGPTGKNGVIFTSVSPKGHNQKPITPTKESQAADQPKPNHPTTQQNTP
jgi:translation initiation factor IF-3